MEAFGGAQFDYQKGLPFKCWEHPGYKSFTEPGLVPAGSEVAQSLPSFLAGVSLDTETQGLPNRATQHKGMVDLNPPV